MLASNWKFCLQHNKNKRISFLLLCSPRYSESTTYKLLALLLLLSDRLCSFDLIFIFPLLSAPTLLADGCCPPCLLCSALVPSTPESTCMFFIFNALLSHTIAFPPCGFFDVNTVGKWCSLKMLSIKLTSLQQIVDLIPDLSSIAEKLSDKTQI